MIGSILNGYKVEARLRETGQGTLYRAIDESGTLAAIFVLSEAASARPERRKAFLTGARTALDLRHPNILKVIEVNDGDPFPYAIQELFESEDLKVTLWTRRDRIAGQEFYILRQVAAALRHCHDHGIIHGDIKPENILVGERATTKLTGFSLAQSAGSKIFKALFSRPVAGSPLYMSPEQIQKKPLDPASDVYSFGVVAYEVLTKRPPFLGTTPESIQDKHLSQLPPPMSNYLESPDSALESLLGRMLAKKPGERPMDWTQIIFELTNWERKATQIRTLSTAPRDDRRN